MWICFDLIGSREGLGASISFLILLYSISNSVDASLTNADTSNIPHNTVTSDISSPTVTHHENDECRNVTTDDRASMYTSLIVYISTLYSFALLLWYIHIDTSIDVHT